ncbi:TlpA family protein disulfide reductase [Bartonella sp. B35(2025)]
MIPQIFTNQKNNNNKAQFLIASFIIALSLYAITNNYNKKESFFFNVISAAKAQETNTNKPKSEKIMAIKKAAKGFFTHIQFADIPYNINHLSFKDAQEKEHKLSEFNGKPILIHLWAIWCTPCREEMPELAQLKREMGGDTFDIIAINIDNTASIEKIQQFLHNVHADNLVYYRDKTMGIFKNMRKQGMAIGLPTTYLIDKDGNLIASFNGAAPWASDDAKALIKAVIKETK